ncbi:hypothetical protein K458DRAFT_398192 [Lentithecium fluviatile CBS 122367]|uniref:Uncharacterized protein n=1 Tax=Lentithecium fluviatile CBS 122367 TaxID=1168545 RepID=A0A6G1JMI6_9PLEO|nr:hypothetical protein K458DRAFT_398192 [Lentithecium fluviatile CBS 122367]
METSNADAADAADQAPELSSPLSPSILHLSDISPPRLNSGSAIKSYSTNISMAYVQLLSGFVLYIDDANCTDGCRSPSSDVVSTFGAHLVTQPNTSEHRSAGPVDAHDLHQKLELALSCHKIRIRKYGPDIADNWRPCYTPVEARQRGDGRFIQKEEEEEQEKRRKALEAYENVAREEVVDNTTTSMLHFMPTPTDDADTDCKDKHPQQLPQVPEALNQMPITTIAKPLSPQSQPSKRRRLTPEEDEDTTNCTKFQHLLPKIPADNALGSGWALENVDNSIGK